MLTKRDLGIGYIAGFGIGVSCVLVVRLLLLQSAMSFVVLVATVSGLLLSLGLVYAGYWFMKSELDGGAVWTISKRGALGIGLLTAMSVVVFPLLYSISPSDLSLVISNIAAGGVVGVLLGGIGQLRKEHDRIRTLNQRNVVLNRVLRHNIRNEMGIIIGWADLLETELGGSEKRHAERIKEKADEVSAMGDKARQIEQALDHETTIRPVDAVTRVERQRDAIEREHPEAVIDTDLPAEAWVKADEFFELVVENLLRNAVQHSGEQPRVHASVTRVAGDTVEVRIEDNGPGIPEREREVLVNGGQTPVYHGTGLGLWLVKWLVEGYDGDLSFEETENGSAVGIKLYEASPDPSERSPEEPSSNAPTDQRSEHEPTV